MKTRKQTAAILTVLFFFSAIFYFSACSGDDDDDNNQGVDNNGGEDRTVGTPAELKYEKNSNGINFLWKSVADASFYQLNIAGHPDTAVTTPYYLFRDKLSYNTEYEWKVRAGKKLTNDTVYSDWATSTIMVASPFSAKFTGIWHTDSVDVSATLGTAPLPVDSFIPKELDVSRLIIQIDEDETDENNVFLSVAGLNDYLPIEEQNLNKVPMEADSKSGTITGEIEIDQENNKITRSFDPPLPLSDLGIQFPSSIPIVNPENIAITTVTLTVNKVDVFGRLTNEEATSAFYEIKANVTIKVETNDPTANGLLSLYFSTTPVYITLTVFSSKAEASE
jgi:hypothetical protein